MINKASAEDQLKQLTSLVHQLGVFIEWLDNAHTEQTPRGLVQLLANLISRMNPGTKVVARPQAKNNYSILDLGKVLKRLVEDYIPHSKQSSFSEYLSVPVKLISFPRIQRDNILAHAIFGHELGHPIADDYLEQEKGDPAHIEKHKEIKKQVDGIVQKKLANIDVDEGQKLVFTTQTFDRILQIRKRALQELISDAVGIMIFGPSAFFACYELFWSGNLDAKPAHEEWYPPSRMRLRLMLELMEKLDFPAKFNLISKVNNIDGYIFAVNAFIDDVKQLVVTTSDQNGINLDPELKLAYDWMNESLKNAIEYATKKTKEVAFKSDEIFQQLPELLQRLEIGIPPNEVGDPEDPVIVDCMSSLLSAWLYKLQGVNPKTGETLSDDEVDRLHQKTLSGIEYVILQDSYRRYLGDAQSEKGVA
ncbi:MAG: hypothetical protein ACC651_09650 [Candidatus Scalindua sp.]